MADIIEVPTAGYGFTNAPNILKTSGIGSCLAVSLYSGKYRKGALVHFMLPRAGQIVINPCIYADTALSLVLEKFVQEGVQPTDLIAKLIGGAQMFPKMEQNEMHDIGIRNTEEAARLLQILHIPVVARSVGGNRGRSLTFDLETGNVSINKVF
jgi:chemotaxis protein CheD